MAKRTRSIRKPKAKSPVKEEQKARSMSMQVSLEF